jgi:hypothetical protein
MNMTYREQLEAVARGEIPGRWIVGSGYKLPRIVAIKYLKKKIAAGGEK